MKFIFRSLFKPESIGTVLKMGLCQSIKKKETVKIEADKIYVKKEEKGFKIEVKPIVSGILFRSFPLIQSKKGYIFIHSSFRILNRRKWTLCRTTKAVKSTESCKLILQKNVELFNFT